MGLLDFLRPSPRTEPERKNEIETREVVHGYFTVYYATMTYPDGSTEPIEFTKADYDSHEIVVWSHSADDYVAGVQTSRYGPGRLTLNVEYNEPRRFSYANIRDMDIEREEEMIAAGDVEAKVWYKRDGPDDDWTERRVKLESDEVSNVQIYHKDEWEAMSDD